MAIQYRPVENLVMNKFWKDKRVLITGHTGFKGSWLSLWLNLLGAKVSGYALSPPTEPSLFEINSATDILHSNTIADIRDIDLLIDVFNQQQPEVVFHLAAQPLVRESYYDPLGTFSTNVMGTVHVLETARRTDSVRVLVNVTTDKCYQNREWQWGYRENDRLGGHDPYSSSKTCSEVITESYRKSFFSGQNNNCLQLASARAGNVIGGGDWASDRLIPDAIRAYMSNSTLIIRNPDSTRPWQHVLEPLSGYLLLAEKLWTHGRQYSRAWNFGPDQTDCCSVGSVADRICTMLGEPAQWTHDKSEQPSESGFLSLDSTLAHTLLGWSPTWQLQAALSNTIEWYRAYLQNKDMKAITLEQIRAFQHTM